MLYNFKTRPELLPFTTLAVALNFRVQRKKLGRVMITDSLQPQSSRLRKSRVGAGNCEFNAHTGS